MLGNNAAVDGGGVGVGLDDGDAELGVACVGGLEVGFGTDGGDSGAGGPAGEGRVGSCDEGDTTGMALTDVTQSLAANKANITRLAQRRTRAILDRINILLTALPHRS